ncbi:hypothetical protein J6590_011894 [Homalodisca vitripennis]|nr:hypothetical protein J6590_011894 [Homalodisca vitripennis]
MINERLLTFDCIIILGLPSGHVVLIEANLQQRARNAEGALKLAETSQSDLFGFPGDSLNDETLNQKSKPSQKHYLGTNGLKVTSEPPPIAGQADGLQGQDRSTVTYPSSSHSRRCLT